MAVQSIGLITKYYVDEVYMMTRLCLMKLQVTKRGESNSTEDVTPAVMFPSWIITYS